MDNTARPKVLFADEERLMSAEELLDLLWSRQSRPSLRWLREQQSLGLPFYKVAGRVWFRLSEVKKYLEEHRMVRRREPQPTHAIRLG